MSEGLILAAVTYLLVVIAFFMPHKRAFHMPVMAGTMVFDVLVLPIYLILTKDWYKRLIEQEEIFSFMIWMHFILVLTLYALYVLQIMTVKKMLAGDETARKEHRNQGKGILIARGLVVLSAFMLIEPAEQA